MALPADYRPRKNDVLLVRLPVKYDAGPHDTTVDFDAGYASATSVKLDQIMGIYALHFEPGEAVTVPRAVNNKAAIDTPATVIAVRNGRVWVEHQDGSTGEYATTTVIRAAKQD